jgi:hypothetical protein
MEDVDIPELAIHVRNRGSTAHAGRSSPLATASSGSGLTATPGAKGVLSC